MNSDCFFFFSKALYVLIKQMNCKEKLVVDALLEQLSTAHNWKVSFIRAPSLPWNSPRMEERKE